MKGLLAFMIMMILSASCQFVDRETARSQVKDLASMLSHPPGSTVVLTADELGVAGSSETCSGSNTSYFIGTSQTRADITDYYDQKLGAGWSKQIETNAVGWSKLNGRFNQSVGIAFENTRLDHAQPYISTVIATRKQYSTTYELIIVSFTADTCKGG